MEFDSCLRYASRVTAAAITLSDVSEFDKIWPGDLHDAAGECACDNRLLSPAHLKIPEQPLRNQNCQQVRENVNGANDIPESNLILRSAAIRCRKSCG